MKRGKNVRHQVRIEERTVRREKVNYRFREEPIAKRDQLTRDEPVNKRGKCRVSDMNRGTSYQKRKTAIISY